MNTATSEPAAEPGIRKLVGEDLPSAAPRPQDERSGYGLDPFCNPVCPVDDRTPFTGSSG